MCRRELFLVGKQESAGVVLEGFIHPDNGTVQSRAHIAHGIISRGTPHLDHRAEKPVLLGLPDAKVSTTVEGKGKLRLGNGRGAVAVGLLSIPGGRFESLYPGPTALCLEAQNISFVIAPDNLRPAGRSDRSRFAEHECRPRFF